MGRACYLVLFLDWRDRSDSGKCRCMLSTGAMFDTESVIFRSKGSTWESQVYSRSCLESLRLLDLQLQIRRHIQDYYRQICI